MPEGEELVSQELPAGWAEDPLSAFLDRAQRNTLFMFESRHEVFERLSAIDRIFDRIGQTAPPEFPAFFLARAHSAYWGALRIGLSGQIPETYTLLRSVLDWALYAAYLNLDEERARRWLRRHDSEESRRAVRDEFRIPLLLETLGQLSPTLRDRVSELYERAIDFGAHPNERALTSGVRPEAGGTWEVDYFTPQDSLPLRAALKTACQVEVCCLDVFGLLFQERFELLGVFDSLDHLRRDL